MNQDKAMKRLHATLTQSPPPCILCGRASNTVGICLPNGESRLYGYGLCHKHPPGKKTADLVDIKIANRSKKEAP